MDEIELLMKGLNLAHRQKDWADMCNIITLELLEKLKYKAKEVSEDH